MRYFWLAVLLLPSAVLAQATTAYVTDVLRLNVYATPDFSGNPTRTLMSGDAFEVLLRERLATEIRLPDGTTGFVRSAYIVDEKPARLIVAETQAEVDRLSAELADTRAAFEDPAAEIDGLKLEISNLTAELATSTDTVGELETRVARLQSSAERYSNSVPLTWSLAALLVALIGGFLGGLKYVDNQIRKRHGGIRVL